MASTIEVFLAGLALTINTIAIMMLYFAINSFLGPYTAALEHINAIIGGPLKMGEFTYLYPYIFAVLLIFEIIMIIAFIVVVGRRTVYEDIQ